VLRGRICLEAALPCHFVDDFVHDFGFMNCKLPRIIGLLYQESRVWQAFSKKNPAGVSSTQRLKLRRAVSKARQQGVGEPRRRRRREVTAGAAVKEAEEPLATGHRSLVTGHASILLEA
jgi:hypothetical protein